MSNSPSTKWIKGITFALVIMATISCSIPASLLGPTPTAEIREVTRQVEVTRIVEIPVTRIVTIEASTGLAGDWYNSVTDTLTTIVWTGSEFRVTRVYDTVDDEIRLVTNTEWDGTRIRWTYLIESTGLSVSYTMTSLVGDELHCDWINSNDTTGTRTLERR